MPLKTTSLTDWNEATHMLVIKFKLNNKYYAIDKQNKIGGYDQVELWYLNDKNRVPIRVRSAKSYYGLATNILADTYTIDTKNCRRRVLDTLSNVEILVDWTSGYIYYKDGYKLKRQAIKDYILIKKPSNFYVRDEIKGFDYDNI